MMRREKINPIVERKWLRRREENELRGKKKEKKMNDKEKIDNYRISTNKMQKQGLTVEA